MRAALVAHLVLLIVALALAYSSAHKDEASKDEGEVVLLDGAEADLTQVAYRSQEAETELVPYDEAGERAWAATMVREVAEKPAAKPAAKADEQPNEIAGGADAGIEPPAAEPAIVKEKKTLVFPVGSSTTRSLEALVPFKVKRTLTDVPAEKLEAMGLAEPEATLELTLKGKTHRFEVGGKTYGGNGRYLRGEDGRVHLVDAAAVRGFEGTETRMAERRLLTLAAEDVERLTVHSAGKTRVFLHQDREQPKKRYFAAEETPEERSEEAGSVVSGLRRLRAKEFFAPGDVDLSAETLQAEVVLKRAEGGELRVRVYAPSNGRTLVEVGRWAAEVTEGMGKEVLEDITAALP